MSSTQRGQILAHRGLWTDPAERNTPGALEAALSAGFGIETDLRDSHGALVVSHDPPLGNEPLWRDLIHAWGGQGLLDGRTFALNLKSDGLGDLLENSMRGLDDLDYFLFDMTLPATLDLGIAGWPVAARRSEFEPAVVLPFQCSTLWIDSFNSDWFLFDDFISRLPATVRLALVSPEIHGRDPISVWEWALTLIHAGRQVLICTDRPLQLWEFLS